MRSIVMIGAGGTASHLIHPLIAYLMGQGDFAIHLYDADKVESQNLLRQLFYPHEVGQHKVSALAARFPEHISPHRTFLGPDNIETAIRENDTVLICADNMAVRRLINERAKRLHDITVINGGNEEQTYSCQVYVVINNQNITPSLDFYSPEYEVDDGPDRSLLSCAQLAALPGGEQTVVANNSAATSMLQALYRVDAGVYIMEQQWTKLTGDIIAGTVQTSDVRLIGGLNERD